MENDKRGSWIQTFSGIKFYPLDPRAEDVLIEDIAHSLSYISRYNGHTTEFYSVAFHSLLLSYIAEDIGLSINEQLLYLLHDAHEAYIGDITQPMKENFKVLGLYDIIENIAKKIDDVVFKKYNIIDGNIDLDKQIVANEKLIYMRGTEPGAFDWPLNQSLEPLKNVEKLINGIKLNFKNNCKISCQLKIIESLFLTRFENLISSK